MTAFPVVTKRPVTPPFGAFTDRLPPASTPELPALMLPSPEKSVTVTGDAFRLVDFLAVPLDNKSANV